MRLWEAPGPARLSKKNELSKVTRKKKKSGGCMKKREQREEAEEAEEKEEQEREEEERRGTQRNEELNPHPFLRTRC